jgi:hypothetical protein
MELIRKFQALKKVNIFFLVWVLFMIAITEPAIAQVNAIWALGDGEKVFREDLNHFSKSGNYTWDGKKIHIKGLYNEVLAFQVIIESGNKGAEGISLTVECPVHKRSGKVIGGNSLKYGPGGFGTLPSGY